MKEELLEVLASHAGCQYLSDLHLPWAAAALVNVLPALPAGRFSLWQWNDAVQYIAGVSRSFSRQEDAKAFLSCFCSSLLQEEGLR
jgi:hypothetical protein